MAIVDVSRSYAPFPGGGKGLKFNGSYFHVSVFNSPMTLSQHWQQVGWQQDPRTNSKGGIYIKPPDARPGLNGGARRTVMKQEKERQKRHAVAAASAAASRQRQQQQH